MRCRRLVCPKGVLQVITVISDVALWVRCTYQIRQQNFEHVLCAISIATLFHATVLNLNFSPSALKTILRLVNWTTAMITTTGESCKLILPDATPRTEFSALLNCKQGEEKQTKNMPFRHREKDFTNTLPARMVSISCIFQTGWLHKTKYKYKTTLCKPNWKNVKPHHQDTL